MVSFLLWCHLIIAWLITSLNHRSTVCPSSQFPFLIQYSFSQLIHNMLASTYIWFCIFLYFNPCWTVHIWFSTWSLVLGPDSGAHSCWVMLEYFLTERKCPESAKEKFQKTHSLSCNRQVILILPSPGTWNPQTLKTLQMEAPSPLWHLSIEQLLAFAALHDGSNVQHLPKVYQYSNTQPLRSYFCGRVIDPRNGRGRCYPSCE